MKFSISIVTHSALNLAKSCIESVRRNSVGHECELILTANGNMDAAVYFHELRRAYNPLKIIVVVNDHNEGFIKPNNHALTCASGEYFICLNDDCTVPPGWLERLEAPFLRDPQCALSGAKGTCQSLDAQFVGFPGSRFEYLEGSCLMGKSSLLRQHGLFSEILHFAYAEDADLSLRMRSLGYTIHQADFKLLNHARGATAKTVPGISRHMEHNFAVCQKRWQSYLRTVDRKFECERVTA